MERAHHSSRAGCSRRRTEAHRIASSAGLRVPRVSWQVRLSLLYLWYAAAIGRSWTGRAPVVPRAKGSAWREVTLKVVERDRGSNPTARPRGRPDAFEARFFCMLLLIRSQHSGSGPLIWASRALGCPQGALCGGKFQCRLRVLRPRSVGNRANKS